MTQRLYDRDSFIREFETTVTGCREGKNGFEVTLAETAFYPEGGGQPGDTGVLISDRITCEVTDTREKEGTIVHCTKEALKPGEKVTGRIDWEKRFDLMQNHTGEHIVSGLIHAAFGYNNVGFHMGSDFITIDLDGELDMESLKSIELKANRAVWADLPVKTDLYTPQEAKSVSYRSKKEIDTLVRVVSIDGVDSCACCGTHVKSTGQIGLIKIFSCQKFRSGVRIEMLCGGRALDYMNRIWEQNHLTSVLLSAKPLKTADAVQRVKQQQETAAYRLYELVNLRFAAIAEKLSGKGDCVVLTKGLSPDEVRRLAAAVMEQCKGICLVFSEDENGCKYAGGCEGGDLRELVKQMNAALNGRGGGKPFFVQGSVSADLEQAAVFLSKTENSWYTLRDV